MYLCPSGVFVVVGVDVVFDSSADRWSAVPDRPIQMPISAGLSTERFHDWSETVRVVWVLQCKSVKITFSLILYNKTCGKHSDGQDLLAGRD